MIWSYCKKRTARDASLGGDLEENAAAKHSNRGRKKNWARFLTHDTGASAAAGTHVAKKDD
jgi:hypothetical protein